MVPEAIEVMNGQQGGTDKNLAEEVISSPSIQKKSNCFTDRARACLFGHHLGLLPGKA